MVSVPTVGLIYFLTPTDGSLLAYVSGEKKEQWTIPPFAIADADTPFVDTPGGFASGTIVIQNPAGNTANITLTPGQTLNQVVTEFNNATPITKIFASVLGTGGAHQLSFQATERGSSGDFDLNTDFGSSSGTVVGSEAVLNGISFYTSVEAKDDVQPYLAVGDIDGDGYDDIVVSTETPSTWPLPAYTFASQNYDSRTYVYYGQASPASYDLFTDPSKGFAITGSNTANCIQSGNGIEVADVNKDGFADIILQGCSTSPHELVVIKGRLRTDFDSAVTTTLGRPNHFDINSALDVIKFSRGDSGPLIPQNSADLNNDGIGDIIFTDGTDIFVKYGNSSLASADLNNTDLSTNSFIKFRPYDPSLTGPHTLASPVYRGASTQYLYAGDVNSDNRTDITGISRLADSVNGTATGSTYSILQTAIGWTNAINDIFPTGSPNASTPINGGNGFRIDGAAANSEIHGMLTLDLNDDGVQDIATVSKDGTATIIWGKSNSIAKTTPSNIDLSSPTFGYSPP